MKRAELRKLSEIRLREARLLFDGNSTSGAYYLAGYSVECALKACISKRFSRREIPEKGLVNSIYTHKLQELLAVAELKQSLAEAMEIDPVLQRNWSVVSNWSEQSRYARQEKQLAAEYLDAIDDPDHGVLPWLKLHW